MLGTRLWSAQGFLPWVLIECQMTGCAGITGCWVSEQPFAFPEFSFYMQLWSTWLQSCSGKRNVRQRLHAESKFEERLWTEDGYKWEATCVFSKCKCEDATRWVQVTCFACYAYVTFSSGQIGNIFFKVFYEQWNFPKCPTPNLKHLVGLLSYDQNSFLKLLDSKSTQFILSCIFCVLSSSLWLGFDHNMMP